MTSFTLKCLTFILISDLN